jgi:gluconolactonase
MRVLLCCRFLLLAISFSTGYAQTITAIKVADGFQFVEGPVWLDGIGLLFSDINANTVYRWSETAGSSVYLKPSGNSNGLALDSQGRLLLAQHGNRRIARLEANGSQTSLASHFNAKRLNSPNDLAVKSDGAIFFTDPPYGISSSQQELSFSGIYRISPNGYLSLLEKSLSRPNGLAFSPDESVLYVGDAETRRIYVWDVVQDSTLANKRLFAYMKPSGYTDGMKVDANGNLFATGPGGVWVYAPNGALLETISVPGQTTNCNWGDADHRTLYITSGSAVYKVRPILSALDTKDGIVNDFRIFGNYPNPFNPITVIRFSLKKTERVDLSVYSICGKRVAALVNRDLAAGVHQVVWDAGQQATGVYFYVLQAGPEKKIGRAILLK